MREEIEDLCRDGLDHRIDKRYRYGEHIPLRCKNHPDLRWNTKNIDAIGCRTIFFPGFMRGEIECTCSIADLEILP